MSLSLSPHDHVREPLNERARASDHDGASSSSSVEPAPSCSPDQISRPLERLPDGALWTLTGKLSQRDQVRLGTFGKTLRANLSALEAESFGNQFPKQWVEQLLHSLAPKSLACVKATNRRTYRMIAASPTIEDRLIGARSIDELHEQTLEAASILMDITGPELTASREALLETYAQFLKLLPQLRDGQYCPPQKRSEMHESIQALLESTTLLVQAEKELHR